MRAYQLLRLIAWSWIAVGIVVALSGLFISMIGAPRWLPLPWSDFKDFVESSDGDIYVSIAFYHRVFRYDADGRFVASYPEPSGKGNDLAADLNGRIFLKYRSGHERVAIFSRSWQLLEEYESDTHDLVNWRLDAYGKPIYKQPWKPIAAVDRAAKPGDSLFGNKGRESFTCIDGSRLVRTGSHLERISANGRVTVTYASPWFLRPFTIPWPMGSALVLFIFISYLDHRMEELSKQHPGMPYQRLLILDVVASIILLVTLGGIWFAGLGFWITVNNDYLPEGSSWRILCIVPLIIWFFGGPIVFVKSWKALQKRLTKRFTPSLTSGNERESGGEGR